MPVPAEFRPPKIRGNTRNAFQKCVPRIYYNKRISEYMEFRVCLISNFQLQLCYRLLVRRRGGDAWEQQQEGKGVVESRIVSAQPQFQSPPPQSEPAAEEIAEYMAKKAEKRLKKAAKKLNAKQKLSSYSNDSNPFGDSNLNEKFIWEKKIHRDISRGVLLESFSLKAEKERQKERIAEIEKVKKRREERAIEKAQRSSTL
nr:cactin isoform X1 [Ipomoea batatas]